MDHIATGIEFQMSLLLFVSLAGCLLASRIGQPAVVGIISKVLGCGVPTKLHGMNWKDSIAVGVGMTPRGEVAMIVALLGLDQGIINQPLCGCNCHEPAYNPFTRFKSSGVKYTLWRWSASARHSTCTGSSAAVRETVRN